MLTLCLPESLTPIRFKNRSRAYLGPERGPRLAVVGQLQRDKLVVRPVCKVVQRQPARDYLLQSNPGPLYRLSGIVQSTDLIIELSAVPSIHIWQKSGKDLWVAEGSALTSLTSRWLS